MLSINAEGIAKIYYNEKTYQHCLRVANLVKSNSACPYLLEYKDELIRIALLHDLYEDTTFPHILEGTEAKVVELLTHDNSKSYDYYLKNIKEAMKTTNIIGQLAYWVKIADIKDHLMQTETLTEKLKEKYLKGLAILL